MDKMDFKIALLNTRLAFASTLIVILRDGSEFSFQID